MALTLYRRHVPKCCTDNGIKPWTRAFKRCRCPIHVEGTLRIDGFLRLAVKQTNWDKAKAITDEWDRLGTVRTEPAPEPDPDPTSTHTTLEKAREEFATGYMAAKHLAPGTQRGYRTMLKFLGAFATDTGLRFIDEFDLARLHDWQKTWGLAPRSAAKRVELARCFFDFCRRRKWIDGNPTEDMEVARAGVDQKEPFYEEEIAAIRAAAIEYPTRHRATEAPRVAALIELMLHTGMRIGDATDFHISQLDALRRVSYFPEKANQGQQRKMVTIQIPEVVADRLRSLPLVNGKYPFATGVSTSRTRTDVWRKKLDRVFATAETIMGRPFSSTPTPHRFRHTFIVKMLLLGVSVQDVADAVGHSDPRIILRHYRRWVPGLQSRLDAVISQAWDRDAKPQLVPRKRQA